jgi:STE24 endopeptidase
MHAVLRRFEYQADRFACELDDRFGVTVNGKADMGERLGKALIAIHIENLATVWVDWL